MTDILKTIESVTTTIKPSQADIITVTDLLLPITTGLTIFIAGLTIPENIKIAIQNSTVIQILLIFILIWQGGGGQDITKSVIATISTVILVKVIDIQIENLKPKSSSNSLEDEN